MSRATAYWVIVSGAQPTSFRARERDALVPTLVQLQRTQPDARLLWFDFGRFWESEEAALAEQRAKREVSGGRGRDWRPGGNHKDPRARFKVPRDVKRARFNERQAFKS